MYIVLYILGVWTCMLAFCCWEENITVDVSAEQEQRRLLAEYQGKLVVEGEIILDPISIKNGWLTEKLGRPKWPSVYITDISDYLNTKNPETLMKRLLNEYKEGKAYRYFSSEWVKEVHYHDLGEHSDKCIIKSKVTPSQAVNNKAYDVWIVIRKDKNTVPGGQILNAYCSCTAGMMGSCNHIAGVLFRMEYAVKTGMTRPTSTSKACEWTVPKKKTTVKMGKARDFTWKKAKYTQLPRNKDKENETNIKKLNFTPLNKSQQNKVEDGEKLRNELKELLAEDMPNSCFMLLMNKKKLKNPSEAENVKLKLPPTINELSKRVESLDIPECAKQAEFKKQMCVTQDEIDSLNRDTVSQSKSESWKEHRRGRVTASNFHRICKRASSLKKDSSEDPTSVIKLVMGTTEGIQTHAMKHGISLEPVAKRNYQVEMKKVHKRFQSSDSGIILDKDRPFMAASPDLFVSCVCCGMAFVKSNAQSLLKTNNHQPTMSLTLSLKTV
ncbi:uncharacterized protein LOC128552753 isoform X2 [Mercenaria mercenaria]|uniref:uncharacterized protein LOC128552753 isoform X2 n=1 Tax=Mercenaria mercenaria TaxID=6596 RepID=UPI00234EC770|nr:uncharacterized protein LOC128552753 isoform X2 [Mercenaria mercenaria]